MKINGKCVKGDYFAYDGCHKIYIIEDEGDLEKAIKSEYHIYPINELQNKYENSCPLRFINNWKLNLTYVGQDKKAIFEE